MLPLRFQVGDGAGRAIGEDTGDGEGDGDGEGLGLGLGDGGGAVVRMGDGTITGVGTVVSTTDGDGQALPGGPPTTEHTMLGDGVGDGLAQEVTVPDASGCPHGGGAPTSLPPILGVTKEEDGEPATAAFMKACQMVAGNEPPVTAMPRTLLMVGVWPVAGSGGKPIHTAATRLGV